MNKKENAADNGANIDSGTNTEHKHNTPNPSGGQGKMLIDEQPLIILPHFAAIKEIGLNGAIVLQQIHYWLKQNERDGRNYHDGRYWTYNTFDAWQDQFPFWCIRTIKSIFTKLENDGLLIVGNYNESRYDRTKWYSIDYDVLNELCEKAEFAKCKSCTIKSAKFTPPIPKTNTENNLENIKRPTSQDEIGQSTKSLDDFTSSISAVNDFVDIWYPKRYGREHKKLTRRQRLTFARKLTACASELELDMDAVLTAIRTAINEEQRSDMTIFLATTEQQLSYWLVRTGVCTVVELRGTSYDYEQLVNG